MELQRVALHIQGQVFGWLLESELGILDREGGLDLSLFSSHEKSLVDLVGLLFPLNICEVLRGKALILNGFGNKDFFLNSHTLHVFNQNPYALDLLILQINQLFIVLKLLQLNLQQHFDVLDQSLRAAGIEDLDYLYQEFLFLPNQLLQLKLHFFAKCIH